MAYVEFPFADETTDDVLTVALERIADRLPGWTPNEASVEYAVLSEMVRLALDTRLLATDVSDAIFRAYGEKLVGLAAQPGVTASATVTFTFTDTDVHTVLAGTQVLWPSGGDPVLFSTVADVSNVAGNATTPGVQVMAVEAGTQANGLAAQTLSLVDSLSFVSSVQGTTATGGGADPESDPDYLDRLSQSLQLLRRIPVLARDFSILARDTPGVFRALALDGYNPDNGTSNNERTITVAPVAEDGSPVAANVRDDLQNRLDSEREVNFVVRTIDPTYTALTVTFTAVAVAGADVAVVLADAVDAVKTYLSPAVWGGGDERPPTWRLETVVRYLDIVAVIGRTPGVKNVTDVTLNGGTANVTLTGPAPLPAANPDVTGTVTA